MICWRILLCWVWGCLCCIIRGVRSWIRFMPRSWRGGSMRRGKKGRRRKGRRRGRIERKEIFRTRKENGVLGLLGLLDLKVVQLEWRTWCTSNTTQASLKSNRRSDYHGATESAVPCNNNNRTTSSSANTRSTSSNNNLPTTKTSNNFILHLPDLNKISKLEGWFGNKTRRMSEWLMWMLLW